LKYWKNSEVGESTSVASPLPSAVA
jgi:hypothetical protein